MATLKGRAEVRRYLLETIPLALHTKILRGAARAAAKVVAEEAKERSISSEVSGAVKVSSKQDSEGHVIARVLVKGPGAYIAPWLEYGTDPHFISVDPAQSGGRTAGRINKLAKDDDNVVRSLMINGKFVGTTVRHPGARPHPFLRPALDIKRDEALAAAQGYIDARLAREGLGGADVPETEE